VLPKGALQACTDHLVDRHQLLKSTLPRPPPSNRFATSPVRP